MNKKIFAAAIIASVVFSAGAIGVAAENSINSQEIFGRGGGNASSAQNIFAPGLAKKANASSSAEMMSYWQKEYARLMELLAQLKEKMARSNATTTSLTNANIACIKPALEIRETMVASAYSTMSSCVNTALGARKTALLAAWTIAATGERNSTINKVWNDFRKARKECQNTYKTASKNAWSAYKIAANACRPGIGNDSLGSESDQTDSKIED